ncbi:GGDEF domain-containing response regulator [Thalassotalea atypica]|uniref:GGDEF domain-containing response regulator n=1 Tax=Thalassotalea atypica TaxID=2054316 RepID=UPI0025726AA9|nr:diguanylate cyclase [Thalassotalea atypica]
MSAFNINNLPQNEPNKIEKPLVMLVDDEIENINVLRQLLESHFKIITGLNGREALNLIDNMVDPKQIQLIITDQRMPELTGVEFLERVVEKMPDTIRILLTGYSDTQVIIDSINKVNLYKFITKPFDPVELTMTVQRGIEAFQMRKELAEYTENLEQLVVERTEELKQKNLELTQALENLELFSLTDQLTSAYNRHFLNKFMPGELAKAKREIKDNQPSDIGMLLIDIDHFKYINDTYGHDAGDKVLMQFTHMLNDTCRQSDWIVRWGGEEFVIITRGLSIDNLQDLAERIRQKTQAYEFDLGCQRSVCRTCSIGITSFPFIKGDVESLTWQQTLKLADLALYAAKNSARNTWVMLYADKISAQENFYEHAILNLQSSIERGVIGFNSQLRKEQVVF